MPTLQRRIDRTERLARAVGRLRRILAAHVARTMETQGHPFVHWQIVSGIAHEGLHSQAALAQRVGMDPAGTSRVLDELEAQGLVRRERDASDRRRMSLELTAKGRRWYERVRVEVMTACEPVFEPLSLAESRQLEALLSKLSTDRSLHREEEEVGGALR